MFVRWRECIIFEWKMVFVILGTQKIPFVRLLKSVDNLIEKGVIQEEVIAQSGHTEYDAKHFRCVPFLSEEEFLRYIDKSSVIITHSGSGSIYSALEKQKKVIAVARLKENGEMLDNHQTELVRKLSQEGCILDGTDSLENAWGRLQSFVPAFGVQKCEIPELLMQMFQGGNNVMLVCNKGGHYSELMCLKRCWEGLSKPWMVTDNNYACLDFGNRFLEFEAFNYSRKKFFSFVGNCHYALRLCKKLKPDYVVSTGAGIAVPLFFAAKLFGAKLVFIESRARVYSKSKAGRILYPIADVFIVQWSEMLSVYGPKAQYFGTF